MHAIKEGRQVGEEVDRFLVGSTRLPHQGGMAIRSWIAPPITTGANVQELSEDKPVMEAEAESVEVAA